VVTVPHGPEADITGQAITISAWTKPNGTPTAPIVNKAGQYAMRVGGGPIDAKFVQTGALFLGAQGGHAPQGGAQGDARHLFSFARARRRLTLAAGNRRSATLHELVGDTLPLAL
jgi:hypothetical protein